MSFTTISIAGLRADTNSNPPPDLYYYITDVGKEGFFRLDDTDTTSLDNYGTIIVTASTPVHKRYKRVYEGPVNIK